MKHIIGYCGRCGGEVSTPVVWHGVVPPKPTCESCGRIARDPDKPTLPMQDKLERWARVSLDAGEFDQAEKLRREAMSAETYGANVDLLRRRIAQMRGLVR